MGELKPLILGDGLLGSEIQRQTGWDFVSRKSDNFDINNLLDLPKGYNVIINCIANTDTYSTDKEAHWNINYKFVSELINYCNKAEDNIKLVHISTDYVYAGSNNNASEEDVPVHCNNWYGYTKLLGDGLVQLQSNNYLLCRCTHKPKPFPYDEAWMDQVGNFDYVDEISSLIIDLINQGASGLFNVGTETKTMYELASKTKGVSKTFTPAHVPKNQSMDITKMKEKLNSPFFSIAIPTYGYNGKGAEFLEHSLKILSEQIFKDFEVVISDHSVDDTILNILPKWNKLLNIRYFRNEIGRGIISPNINNAMRKCLGKYIKVLFQDDFLFNENSLQIQYDFIINNNVDWLMTTFYHSNDGFTFYRLYNPVWNDMIWTGNNTMGCPSGMTIKNKDLIFFDEGLNWLMDVDYYKRMSIKYGTPKILNEITAVNRTWGARLTDTIGQELKNKEYKILVERYG